MWAGCEEQNRCGAEDGWRIRDQTSRLGGGFGRSLAKPPAQAQEKKLGLRTDESVKMQRMK